METQQRRTSHKTSKNGGKREKARTGEEEARRREVVTEKLRQRLDLESRALKVVERLLDDSVAEDFLVDCAKFITSANYKDAIEERVIVKLCGYPICPNKLGKIPTQRYKICTKTNKVYDITERKCYCSNFCYKASKEFELQISDTPLWLRQHESPQEIKLLMRGDGGSSGEVVILSDRRLQEEDVENLLTAEPGQPDSSRPGCATGDHSDTSDVEQEQDFVSSVVSQRPGRRVHWGALPKRTDEDEEGKQGKMERREKKSREGDEEEIERHQSQKAEKGKIKEDDQGKEFHALKTENKADAGKLHVRNTEEKDSPKEPNVEDVTAKIDLCSLSDTVPQTVSLCVDSTPAQAEPVTLLISPPLTDSQPPAGNKPLSSSTLTTAHQSSCSTTMLPQQGLGIIQVGMSKKGAAGLRDLLKNHTAAPRPDPTRLNLLECLRRTLKEWSTEETLKFLYGADHSQGSPFAGLKSQKDDGEEELDEDDLEDETPVEDCEVADAATAALYYKKLREETEQMELRVKEFYKGMWPEKIETPNDNKVTDQDQDTPDRALPLVDSQSQHLIQKHITVEKLTNCLRNILGPLHLTMSDVSADLNNLVKTFRFSNTNIIHKTPEWTLIALVLLHLLSEVSLVVREALEMTASVAYLNTMMEELSLQQQDLLNLVRLFKTPAH
ncbi:putative RNA polymerase II subunit B1 CTD phosphatase rpap2 [Platichthys flesus]|uniref:putative RNA polymerase II subunit B1 CTD phosphatase rpap2 n=1 Tax=Platichthys flesus TaxID=8260 RepID=UPI001A83DA69|nr:putative RNA polymerase II subunit B1 CTD phosphatase rpap2 [Platichthys flesus]